MVMPSSRDARKYRARPEIAIELLSAATRAIAAFHSGSGGGVIHRVHPLPGALSPFKGLSTLIDEVVERVAEIGVVNGDIICCCSIVFSVAQGRKISQEHLFVYGDPCDLPHARLCLLADEIEQRYHFPVDAGDIYGINREADGFYLLPDNPNGLCAAIADSIHRKTATWCDVLISDTETGIIPGMGIIGFPTAGAMPIGSTAGLRLEQCLEVAYLAEMTWGADKRIPIIRIEPERTSNKTWRNAKRPHVGLHRGYSGRLDFFREGWDIYFECQEADDGK